MIREHLFTAEKHQIWGQKENFEVVSQRMKKMSSHSPAQMCLLSMSVSPVSEVSRFLTHLSASNLLQEEEKRKKKEASCLCAQAAICMLLSDWVLWFTLPVLCTESIAERKSMLWSLVMHPLTFTSDCMTHILIKELAIVTQHFVQSLHAAECCFYRQRCILGNVIGEKGKLQCLLEQCSSECCACCYLVDCLEQLSNREWRPTLMCLFLDSQSVPRRWWRLWEWLNLF